MKKKMGWMPIVFYVLAVIMGLYTLYALFSTVSYINGMISAGYVSVSDSLADILAYFVTSVGVYLVYSVALWFMGYVVDVLQRGIQPKKTVEEELVEEIVNEMTEEAAVIEAVVEEAEKEAAEIDDKVIRYCKKCYAVIDPENVPDECPECGEPLK